MKLRSGFNFSAFCSTNLRWEVKAVPLDSLRHIIQRIIFYLIFFKKYIIIIIENKNGNKWQFRPGPALTC